MAPSDRQSSDAVPADNATGPTTDPATQTEEPPAEQPPAATGDPAASFPNTFLAVAAVVVGTSLLQFANGLLGTLLPIRLTDAGVSVSGVGMMAVGFSTGFLAACLWAPRAIAQVGHIRVFAVFATAASAATLAFTIETDPYLWTALRAVTGFCTAGLLTVAESWLNERTPQHARGRVISAYMLFTKLALAGGQISLAVGGTAGLGVFMLASAAYSVALMPVAMTRAPSPSIPKLTTLPLRELYRVTPAAFVGCFAVGLINPAVINIGPAYAAQLGIQTSEIAVLMALLQIGSLALQWPLGWLSDRIDRRWVIIGCSVSVTIVSLVIAGTGVRWPQALPLLFALWGGFALSLYGVLIAHANDFADARQRVALSSSLLLAFGTGSIAGPSIATGVMVLIGPHGLFLQAAAVSLVLAVFVAYRMTRRAVRPIEERSHFVNLPATSPALAKLVPRDGSPDDKAKPDSPPKPPPESSPRDAKPTEPPSDGR